LRQRISLILALGLFVPLASAFADDASSVPKQISADQLNPDRCPTLLIQFGCASFKKNNGDTPGFLKVLKARCEEEPAGFCASPKSPEVASKCNLDCQKVVEQDRKLVCVNCGPSIMPPVSPPAPTAPKTDPAPSVPPVEVGGAGGVKTPPGQSEGGITETPSGRPTVTPSGKRDPSTITGGGGSSCDSSEQCLREASDADRAAEADARARKEENLRGMRGSRDNEVSTVSGAADFLNTWKRQIDGNPAAATADTRAKFLSDQRLVQQAQAAFPPGGAAGHGSFTADDALRANDDGIMRELSMTVESSAQVKDFSKEAKKAKAEEDKFHALAQETDRRVQALQVVPGSPSFGGPTAPGIAASSIATSPAESESKSADSPLALTAKEVLAPEKSTAKPMAASAGIDGGLSGKSAAVTTPLANGTSSELRDRLRKRLADRGDAGGTADTHDAHDALDGTSFGQQGSLVQAPGIRVPASVAVPAGKSIAEEVMADFSSQREKRFTMRSSEVDAELRRLTQQASEAGLLGLESASLFDRVRQAHRSCLQRDCVNGR